MSHCTLKAYYVLLSARENRLDTGSSHHPPVQRGKGSAPCCLPIIFLQKSQKIFVLRKSTKVPLHFSSSSLLRGKRSRPKRHDLYKSYEKICTTGIHLYTSFDHLARGLCRENVKFFSKNEISEYLLKTACEHIGSPFGWPHQQPQQIRHIFQCSREN